MLLEVSKSKPTRKGRSVCRLKNRIFLLGAIVENPEIIAIQIRDDSVLLGEHRKQDVDQVYVLSNGLARSGGSFSWGRSRRRRLRLLRAQFHGTQ